MSHGVRSSQTRNNRRSAYGRRRKGDDLRHKAVAMPFPPGSHSDERQEYQLTWSVAIRARDVDEAMLVVAGMAEDVDPKTIGITGRLICPDGNEIALHAVPTALFGEPPLEAGS